MTTQSDINKKRQLNTNFGENVDQEQSPPQQKNLNDMDGTYHNYPLVKKEIFQDWLTIFGIIGSAS